MRPSLLLAVSLTIACGSRPDPDCVGNPWHPDADGDGFGDPAVVRYGCEPPGEDWTRDGSDCDDTNPWINPLVPEEEDGVDEDCDGVPDDGTAAHDDDGDGYCEAAVCTGEGVLPGDCDDGDPERHPGAPERCNGLDDDCDGVVPPDEVDGDGDGAAACADCDDADPSRHPGAVELCDGIDQDCDGATLDRDLDGDGTHACEGSGGGWDVLLVVDGRRQAAALRDRLAVELPGLVAAVRATGREARITLVDGDGDVLAAITPGQPAASDVLVRALGAADAVVWPRAFAVAEAFPWRPGAARTLWVVAGTDEGSAVDLDRLARRLDATFGAVAAGWESCQGAGRSALISPRLAYFAGITGGALRSACTDGWTALVAATLPDPVPADCDDDDPTIHPGAVERCDGVDRDCDGEVRDDDDGDGVDVCEGDCDDRDPERRPGRAEACNGVDDDCDGTVPDDEFDFDGDGLSACAGDCDDADARRRPGVPEVCGNGIDEDCSGADATPGTDRDGDGHPACGGDCDDGDPTVFPFAPEHRFDLVDDDCDGALDGEDTEIAEPHALATMTSVEVRGTAVVTFCGQSHDAVAVSGDGFVLPGGGTWFDVTPSHEDAFDHAPFAAAGWAALDAGAWEETFFFERYEHDGGVWTLRRGADFGVVFDAVPYRDGGELISVLTLGSGRYELSILDARFDGGTLVGFACEPAATWLRVPADARPACVWPKTYDAQTALLVAEDGAPPLRITSNCFP